MKIYNRTHHNLSENYGVLLLLYANLILQPAYAFLFPFDPNIIFLVSYSLLILVSIYNVTFNLLELFIGLSLGCIVLISYWGRLYEVHQIKIAFAVERILSLLFFGYLGQHVITHLVSRKIVDLKTIYGVVLGYLIIGTLGGDLFILLEYYVPESFNVGHPEEDIYSFFYFSYIILTSVGFGDFTPQTPPARALTLFIAILGQLYIATVMAIIVAKYIASPREPKK